MHFLGVIQHLDLDGDEFARGRVGWLQPWFQGADPGGLLPAQPGAGALKRLVGEFDIRHSSRSGSRNTAKEEQA